MLKQYVIVPYKPKMSKGKIASQVAHATFMALRGQIKSSKALIEEWESSGMCVIVLGCKDIVQLMGISKYLDQWKVPNHMYIDEGFTEIPMGTPTALATGVLDEKYSWMFKNLQLFRS